jgi:hypothetical protein
MHDVTGPPPTPAVRRDRRTGKGVYGPAFLLSVLMHAALLLGISFRVQLEPRLPSVPVSRIIHVTPAMQAYDIVEVAGEVPPIEVQVLERAPQPVRPTTPIAPDADAVAPGERATTERTDPRSVRDRLRYHLNTPQLWRPPSEQVVVEPTPQEIVQQRIAAQLGEYNDSVAAEAAAHARAMDWTVKDEEGGRWGVSPGAIHLGSITIPLGDSHFAVAPGRREEFAGRVRTWNELQDQAVREEARETFKDRVKAIEERMNREREARRAPATVAPAPASGDTTRTSGNDRGN